MASASTAPAPRRSLVARLLTDQRGDLRTTVILSLLAGAVAILSVGTFAALLAAGAGSPETLAVWVVAALILVKVPLLAGAWWILTRRDARPDGWASDECAEILAYIEGQARESVRRPDAAARLAYFAREAWYVADSATDQDKPAAVDTAIRIEAMAAGLGARRAGAPPG